MIWDGMGVHGFCLGMVWYGMMVFFKIVVFWGIKLEGWESLERAIIAKVMTFALCTILSYWWRCGNPKFWFGDLGLIYRRVWRMGVFAKCDCVNHS